MADKNALQSSSLMGTEPISKLLKGQALPASIGLLILSIYGIVDTIFVGRYVGSLAIGAITVVLPITFFIASIGMAIGVGGGSIIARSLGESKVGKALLTFGNQVTLTLGLSLILVSLGFFFEEEVLVLFGAQGNVFAPAQTYYRIILVGIPFLAWMMMSNNVLRAEGKPKIAMYTMIIPAVSNIIMDPIFIVGLDMGLAGAAWATTIAYFLGAAYTAIYFLLGKSELKIQSNHFVINGSIVKEIFAIGGVTLARQGSVSILGIILNNLLYGYGGEMGLSIYGIISRSLMFLYFPIFGITQGMIPIAGFNYGAKQNDRVKEVISKSVKWSMMIGVVIFSGIILFSNQLVEIFTTETELINRTGPAFKIVFFAIIIVPVQIIGAAYFQAIGKALPALFLTLTRQFLFLVPLLFIFSSMWGIDGIWYSFPAADLLATLVTYLYLRGALKKLSIKV